MKENEINLNGTTSGIVALDQNGSIIKFGNYKKKLSLFKNILLLEAAIERESKNIYELGICIDGNIIPMSKVIKESDYYEYFVNENEVSYIYPEIKDKIIMCGYFNFGNSPCERTKDKEAGKEFSKNIYTATEKNLCYQQRKGLLKTAHHVHGHLFNIHGKLLTKTTYGNTLVLRIMKPYDLLQVNNMRRECEFRVLPFKKENDNYKNLYFCFSRDIYEFPGDKKYYDAAYNILDEMIEYFDTVYPELEVGYEVIMFGNPFEL